jgi:DNA-binding CsgD family transcriptional regulator/DNA-binding transcriptional ArsR family regulator
MTRGRGPAVPLLGRNHEFATLTSVLANTSQAGSALVVEGEAGIGKTTMLAAVGQWADRSGFRVLSCAGVQSQSKVGFAAVHELVHPLLHHADELPTHQRAALYAAFGMSQDGPPDPLTIGVAILGLVEEAAARQPLLLIVDDAQWLDGSSLHVLTFLGRRLTNAPVMLLCAARRGYDGRPGRLASLPRLFLGPVDDSTARTLLADAVSATGERALGEGTRRRILAAAAGNPLAIQELTKAIAAAGEQNVLTSSAPLPTTRRIEQIFLEQLQLLPETSRRLLALISAADDAGAGEILDAAGRLGLSEDALDPLERCGLIAVDNGLVRVRHPLIRSVAYRAAPLSQRRAFHRCLAEAATDPVRAAWQRGAAAYGPDEALAAELEAVAALARDRGANGEAAAAFRRAAELSPAPQDRVRRLAAAIMPAYRAGSTVEAVDLLTAAEPLADDPVDLFELSFARFTLSISAGIPAPPLPALLALADRLGGAGAQCQQIRLLAAAAAQCRMHGMSADDRHAVAQSLHALEPLGDARVDIALATVEDAKYARDFRTRADELRARIDGDLTALMSMGLAAESVSDLAVAQNCWDAAIRVAHGAGAPTLECEALRGAARAQIIAGHLQEAAISAQAARRIATDVGLGVSAGAAAALLCRIHAWKGEWACAAEALAAAREHLPTDTTLMWRDELAWAGGLLELARRNHREAFGELAQMTRDHGARRWALADLAEAAAASGDTATVAQVVDDIAAQAATLGSPHVTMLVHRSRALLATDGHEVEHHFLSALATDVAEQAPLEYARTQLCYGEWLRRRRRIVDARAQLSPALRTFEVHDAHPFAERTRAELRAAGVQLPGQGAGGDPGTELTPQELQIARLAATGLSNRQIADRIYVSHRTVAAHLYKVFPKLGITSRNQLRDALGEVLP